MIQMNKSSVDSLQRWSFIAKVKIEEPFVIPQLNDQSIFTKGWENHLKW